MNSVSNATKPPSARRSRACRSSADVVTGGAGCMGVRVQFAGVWGWRELQSMFKSGSIGEWPALLGRCHTRSLMVILRFLQLCLDIALWRKGPQDLPASSLLATIVLFAYMAAGF